MKKVWIMALMAVVACKNDTKTTKTNTTEEKEVGVQHTFESLKIEPILENDSLSIRAIEVIGNNLAFAANNGTYGLYNSATGSWKLSQQKYDSVTPEFRAVASTASDFFMLSVENPALLYKTGDDGKMKLVYKEEDEKVFYDAIAFWNDQEGIAMGDPTDDCLSVIVTRDGGNSWKKIDCEKLPKAAESEAAFAASNSNIAIEGDHVWILSGGMKSRVFHSADKGKTWEVAETPLKQGKPTLGGYSMDFYDAENGIIIGGNYEDPNGNTGNKAITKDGGKTWNLIADGEEPNYKSSVRYVPNSNGKEIIATGFTGISYSKDAGETWRKLSDEGFYTIRFLNDSTAFAAGSKRIAKIYFK
ncbi:WD40/YVTN/BNR-like repeat-containing protein [Zunongwangia endophytica]|uniref:WD40/YVTN/BNR-like repeat-containing protein n=1 Tax=Zunongwangia endophytica TaxID=1808945 RepID=A0ABV8H759_9FLAO|nr:oxidoreductase [Zunongwangia endophytica]MDN3593843.1 oxidoreductase [Zunongwangia endophytica]